MRVRFARILMNEADASPGGGAVSGTQTVTPAQGDAPAQASSPDPTMVQALASAVRDSVFAELRRSGVLKNKADPAPTASAPAPAASPSSTDFRKLDRALAQTGFGNGLDEQGYQFIETAFAAANPQDAVGWVNTFFASVGRSAPSQPQAPVTTGTQQPTNGATAEPAKPPTAAPPSAAGTPVTPMTSGGLVDIWKLTPQQLDQLGPSGVRREFEKHLSEGARLSGAPPVPRAAQKK